MCTVSGDRPLLGVVLLFKTIAELEKSWEMTKLEIEKWIKPYDQSGRRYKDDVTNYASLFLEDFVHFVLLDDFADWLQMSEPSLYFPMAE